jgi:hypothetical protein
MIMGRWIGTLTVLLLFISHGSLAVENDNTISPDNFKKTYRTLRYEDAIVEMAKPLDVELNRERYLFTCHVIFGSESKNEYVRFYSIFKYEDLRWFEIKRNIISIWDASIYYPNSMPSIELIGFKGQKYVRYRAIQGRGSNITLFKVIGRKVTEVTWDHKYTIDMVKEKLRSDEEIGLLGSHPAFRDTEITESFAIMDKASNCTGCEPVAEVTITFDIIGNKVTPIRAKRTDVPTRSNKIIQPDRE